MKSENQIRYFNASRSVIIDLGVLSVLFILLQILVGVFPGTPINDDWSYARVLEEFVRTGRFIPLGWIGMNLFTQTIMAYPFVKVLGSGWGALHLFALTMGSGVLVLTWVWMMRQGASRRIAFAIALAWMANPLFVGLSGSFMTDVPFLALLILSFFLALRSMEAERSVGAFTLFILSAIIALLLRQPAFWLTFAFSVACFDKKKGWANGRLLIPILCAVAAQLLFDHWVTQTGADLETRKFVTFRMIDHIKRLWHGDPMLWKWISMNVVDFPSYVPMMMIPLLPFWFSSVRRYRADATPAQRYGIIGVFAMGCLYVAFAGMPPFRGNIINSGGLGPLTLRDGLYSELWSLLKTPVLFWMGIWLLTAITGGMMFAAWVGYVQKEKSWRSPIFRMIIVFTVLYSVPFIVTDFFDRYTLPILFCGVTLLPRMLGERAKVTLFTWIWLAAWIGLSGIATHDYQAWQHARWKAGQDLLAQGIDPRRIDGGFEFNGYYLYGRVNPPPAKSFWWVADDEYVIAFSCEPFPNYRQVSVYRVGSILPTTPKHVFVLHRK